MPSNGFGDDGALPSPTISSASESVPAPTARDLQRVKRGLVRATENLRESLADTKERIWETIDDEVQERKQEALTFQKLLDDRIEVVSNAFRAALDNHRADIESQLASIAASAHEAVEKLAENVQQCPSHWSDWTLLDHEEFQGLKARVEALETGSPSASCSGPTLAGELVDAATKPLQESYQRLEERMAELEAEGPRDTTSAGARTHSKKGEKPVVDSKLVANIGPLTDDKDSFRQWGEKMVNVLTHLQKGYGPAIACIKDLVDRGRGPEDTHRGMNKHQMSAVSSLTLADMVRAGVRASSEEIGTEQLDSDLSFSLVDKAKLKSDILNRIQNLKAQGGINMYAEV